MPKGAIADFVHAWEKMTTNVTENTAELPPYIALLSAPLAELLAEFKAIGAAKDNRRAIKQQEVKDSTELQKRGEKLAGKLRHALIAHFGPDSEFLLAYGILPRRPRKRKKDEPETPEPEKPPESASKEASRAEQPKPENPAPASQTNPASKTA
jgi:hypothetical protein